MPWQAVSTSSLNALTEAQKENNVDIIYSYFDNLGWEMRPIAAMLGNMELEGQMNPAQWENGKTPYTPSAGFGLSQWTPYTKLADFLGSGWETNYTGQLQRIEWEAVPEHQGNIIPDGQWIPVSAYSSYTFQQFAHDTTHTLRWLVECYERSYERGTPMFDQREAYANRWLAYLQTHPPTPPGPTPSTRRKMPLWMMLKPRWRYY